MQQSVFFLIILCLAACSTQKITLPKSDLASLKIAAQKSNKPVTDLFTEYQSKIDSFGLESLSFYSPRNMTIALDNYNTAKTIASKKSTDQAKAKYPLLKALKAIDYASKNKMSVKLHIKKADTHFLELKKLGAGKIMPNKFNDIAHEFSTLIKYIEIGNIKQALNLEEDLITQMLELEIQTLVAVELGKSVNLIEKAITLKADDYAPKSLTLAEHAVSETEQFIRKSYRDRNGIREKSQKAEFLSTKLFHVAQEAYQIQTEPNEKIEQKILHNFAFINQLKEIINFPNTSVSSYANQQENILNLLKTNLAQQARNPELEECRANKETLMKEFKQLEQDLLYQSRSVLSKETNKAVLPELLE